MTERKVKVAKVYIHTSNLDTINSENITYNFITPYYNVIRLAILDTIIPNVFNNITAKNNVFKVTLAGQALSITVPIGYYNRGANDSEADSMLKTLKDLLNTAYNVASGGGSAGVSVTYDPNTNFIAFSNTIVGGTFSITVDSTNTMANTLGFFNSQTGQTILIGDSPYDLSGPEAVYVESNSIFNPTEINSKRRNILAKVFITDSFGGISFNNTKYYSDFVDFNNPIDLSKIDLRLCDEVGDTIDMANKHWQTTLYLEYYGQ